MDVDQEQLEADVYEGDDDGGDEQWEEWEGDDDKEDATQSLFSDRTLPSVEAAMDFDKAEHGFHLLEFVKENNLDDYEVIMLINFIRHEIANGRDVLPRLRAACPDIEGQRPWKTGSYLQPLLPEDPLLFFDFGHDEEDDTRAGEACAAGCEAAGASQVAGVGQTAIAEELRRLQDENEALREALATLKLTAMPAELAGGEDGLLYGAAGGASTSAAAAPGREEDEGASKDEAAVDESYFDSYSYFDIHRDMLADKARTVAYRDALEKNPGLIRGKKVLDLGCGTGILTMFACRGGAASCIGVDASEQIAGFAKQNLEENGFGEEAGPARIVVGKVEDLDAELLRGSEGGLDVLVSEWMGYMLLFETMLDSVLYARDRFLKPGGAVLPDKAVLHIAGVAEKGTGLSFWRDVYGFRMPAIREAVAQGHRRTPMVTLIAPQDLVTGSCEIKSFDLPSMTAEEQDFHAAWQLQACSGDSDGQVDVGRFLEYKQVECHGLVVWFDICFTERFCSEHPVVLSTSPSNPPTHWAQTLLLLDQPIVLHSPGAASGSAAALPCGLHGRISVARSEGAHRSLDISLECHPCTADGFSTGTLQTLSYTMAVSPSTS